MFGRPPWQMHVPHLQEWYLPTGADADNSSEIHEVSAFRGAAPTVTGSGPAGEMGKAGQSSQRCRTDQTAAVSRDVVGSKQCSQGFRPDDQKIGLNTLAILQCQDMRGHDLDAEVLCRKSPRLEGYIGYSCSRRGNTASSRYCGTPSTATLE